MHTSTYPHQADSLCTKVSEKTVATNSLISQYIINNTSRIAQRNLLSLSTSIAAKPKRQKRPYSPLPLRLHKSLSSTSEEL